MNKENYIDIVLKHKDYKIVMFCKDQILVKNKKYFFDVEEVFSILKNDIINLFKNEKTLAINLKFDESFISENIFTLHNVKQFLKHCDDHSNDILKLYQWLTWDNRSKYCGTCGSNLESNITSTEKTCNTCKQSFFPRFSPAIMVLIKHNKKVLLGRSYHFPKGVYSALAGFIDLGESAEDAVKREVREEVGIEVKNIKYFGTQTWPFPDSFMIAFTAEYESGNLSIDYNELEDAKWFDLNDLPKLPTKVSISRKLIDSISL